MPEDVLEEKNIPASQRRRDEARERGFVPKSMDLAAAIILLSGFVALFFAGAAMWNYFGRLFELSFEGFFSADFDPKTDFVPNMARLASGAMGGVVPFLVGMFAMGIAAHVGQFGLVLTSTPLTPDISRIDPVKGFTRIYSLRNFVRIGFNVLKMLLVLGVFIWTLYSNRVAIMNSYGNGVEEILKLGSEVVFTFGIRTAIALILLAILDFLYQRLQYERDLRMSVTEYREELRQFEGDPKVKERIRQVFRQIRLQRMLHRVPEATVVVTNPTEYAVALKYDEGKSDAPILVAKGAGTLAARIKEIAAKNDVPVIEKRELARAIYFSCNVGEMIPEKLYAAAAEVIAFVYLIKKKKIKFA